MKLAVVGSRTFIDYKKMCKEIGILKRSNEIEEIVSGGARGADSLAARYAREHDIPLKVFPANWRQYGNAAGIIRNQEIVDYCDELIAFWDGQSPGTRDTIQKIHCANKPFVVV